LSAQEFTQRWDALAESHSKRLAAIASAAEPKADGTFGTGYLCRTVRKLVPEDSIFAIEAVTNTLFVADNIQATIPGSWINCGGGGLGWSGGGALGIKLASEFENGAGKGKFVVQIVGDGTFLFSVPGSVYWISQRYKIPVLTIVLNNKGKLSPCHVEVLADKKQAGMPRGGQCCSSTPTVWDRKPQTKSSISVSLPRLTMLVLPRLRLEGICSPRK